MVILSLILIIFTIIFILFFELAIKFLKKFSKSCNSEYSKQCIHIFLTKDYQMIKYSDIKQMIDVLFQNQNVYTFPIKLDNSELYNNIVYNLSRIIHIPLAFKTGDMKLLKVLFDDKLHEPYRENLVPDFRYYKDNLKDCAVALSGSGSSIFVIGNMDPSILKKGHILYQLSIGSEIEIRKEEEK